MRIQDHLLSQDDGTAYPFVKSPNQSGGLEARYLVIHYTAGRSAQSAIRTLTSPRRKASAHLVIGSDGLITQLVAFNRKAWHAGPSTWKGLSGMNQYSIGIELDNPGMLKQRGDAWFTYFGTRIDPENVVVARHRLGGPVTGWHAYSGPQLEAVEEVAELLIDTYGLIGIAGHDDIAPSRKRDPGPAFPMEQFRSRLLGRGDDEDDPAFLPEDLFVTTTRVNVRSEPSTTGRKLTAEPLAQGTRVVVHESQGVWRRVDVLGRDGDDVDLEGWVHGRYLQSS